MSGERTLTLTIPIPHPLLTINARRRMHWREQARETRQQRSDAGYWLRMPTQNIPGNILRSDLFGRRTVRVAVEVRPRKGMKRHDDSAIWEALKPLFDAIEDFGIVADDRQLTHGELTWATERSGEFLLTLVG